MLKYECIVGVEIKIIIYNILILYSLSNQIHTSLSEVNEFLFIHPNPNVCTLCIQKVQLFPLEILDFFNEFLKSGIRRNEHKLRPLRTLL